MNAENSPISAPTMPTQSAGSGLSKINISRSSEKNSMTSTASVQMPVYTNGSQGTPRCSPDPPQQDGYGHFQRDHQQDLARAQQRLARKDVRRLCSVYSSFVVLPLTSMSRQAAGDQCHHNGH